MARILHIEDDPKSRLLVRKILVAAGHEVVDAATGLEGIRLAGEVSPELVLVDINVPDLDGYEVTLRLRGIPRLAGVPIVAITAEGDRATSLAVGCDGFLEKPIDARRFPKQIEKFLRGHRERAEDNTGEIHLRQQSQRIVERLEKKIVELSQANTRLEEMMRLRREFLRNLSHELATPMTPVVGYLKLLLGEELGPLTPVQRKALTSVDAATSRLRSLIDTLLDVSSLETGRLHFYARDYDFAQVAARAIDESKPRFEDRRLTLRDGRSKEALLATGDPDKLRRAMAHLLDNAVKFTPPGGEVAIAVQRVAGPTPEDASYEFIVADNGPGVPPDRIAKILEPFYQVDGSVTRQHGGVGLGLAFARRVAEAMGGDVTVNSPPSPALTARGLTGTEVVLRVKVRPRIPASTHPME
ncbi:sensor histidine kinase [Sandaracinus amylolyticus]|uniref:sensor histidine kinase n=1 Tax=Sandaracinus amylolyticus TaxID=927083 RepID=UPI001F4741EE|nr:hybrid sensor histidine kinase/response regulator [Sandaracinus amylolyticus]UJR80465.1 Polar-differentiation response regulator DivK [Sandaracinus amylolyticus]